MITTPSQNTMYLGIAMFILFLSVAIIVIGIILIHELPYRIAKRRYHPQQDAIRCMAIMGLILFPLWLLAMVWAYMRSGVSYFASSIDDSDINPSTGDENCNVNIENESNPDSSDNETGENEIEETIVDCNAIDDKNEQNLIKIDKSEVELKDSNKKTAENKDDNTGN